MNKRRSRWMTMLALPLVLGVLLGAAKWKQLHPTPTPLDLQERALLRKAVKVEIWNPTHRGQVPIDEFKKALDDFYLIEDDASRAPFNPTGTPPDQIAFAVMLKSSDNTSKAVAMIAVSPLGYYDTIRDFGSQRPRFARSLHPVTQRRFKKLIEENLGIY